jgi:hypothetical protein
MVQIHDEHLSSTDQSVYKIAQQEINRLLIDFVDQPEIISKNIEIFIKTNWFVDMWSEILNVFFVILNCGCGFSMIASFDNLEEIVNLYLRKIIKTHKIIEIKTHNPIKLEPYNWCWMQRCSPLWYPPLTDGVTSSNQIMPSPHDILEKQIKVSRDYLEIMRSPHDILEKQIKVLCDYLEIMPSPRDSRHRGSLFLEKCIPYPDIIYSFDKKSTVDTDLTPLFKQQKYEVFLKQKNYRYQFKKFSNKSNRFMKFNY